MHRVLIAVLRAGIAAAILIGLFGQIRVIPVSAADEVDRFPPYAPYEAPYVTVAIVGVVCVQVVLGAMWMLLAMVKRGALFTPDAFRWVHVILGASVVATLLAFGTMVHLALGDMPTPTGMEDIGAFGGATVCAAAGVAFTLLTVVARGLLRKATKLETELAEVV